MEKVGLDLYDEPTLPSAVQRETSPEVTFSLPSEALDILFSAWLLGNETPEPEHGQMSSGDEKTLLVDPKDSKVTEATCLQGDSEDSDVEQYEGLEVPACPDGTTDSTPTRAKKWKKLRTRISSFLRRVFCFGCLPSQRVVPL
ncbi:hypothetical protein MHYP_G00015710 [Metynnis hypsauchen]